MASELIFQFTDTGRRALINAQQNGTNAVQLTAVGFSRDVQTFSSGMTGITGEFKQLTTISGNTPDKTTLHVTVRDDSSDNYQVRTVALYLADKTLFAIASQNDIILEKASQSAAFFAIDIAILDASIDAQKITFGDTSFAMPPASSTVAGVVKVIDALTSTDDKSALSANQGRILDNKINYRIVKQLNNENLDDIKFYGIYAQSSDSNAQATLNYPEIQAGVLEVVMSVYGYMQRYTTYETKNTYIRNILPSGWSSWSFVSGSGLEGYYDKKYALREYFVHGDETQVFSGDKSWYLYVNQNGSSGVYNKNAGNGFYYNFSEKIFNTQGIYQGKYSGSKSYSDQHDSTATFYEHIETTGNSEYNPLIKQKVVKYNVSGAWSQGCALDGNQLNWIINFASGNDNLYWRFMSNGDLELPGNLNSNAIKGKYTISTKDSFLVENNGYITYLNNANNYPVRLLAKINDNQYTSELRAKLDGSWECTGNFYLSKGTLTASSDIFSKTSFLVEKNGYTTFITNSPNYPVRLTGRLSDGKYTADLLAREDGSGWECTGDFYLPNGTQLGSNGDINGIVWNGLLSDYINTKTQTNANFSNENAGWWRDERTGMIIQYLRINNANNATATLPVSYTKFFRIATSGTRPTDNAQKNFDFGIFQEGLNAVKLAGTAGSLGGYTDIITIGI